MRIELKTPYFQTQKSPLFTWHLNDPTTCCRLPVGASSSLGINLKEEAVVHPKKAELFTLAKENPYVSTMGF
jgi:hypothetical protein